MTRRDQVHKWAVYALGLLPVWILDALVLPRYPLWGLSPMLLPLAVAAVAVLEGSVAGAGFGLGCGLLWTLTYPGISPVVVALLSLLGAGAGALSQYALRGSFLGCLLCSAGTLGVIEVTRLVVGVINQWGSLSAMVMVAAPELALSLCWSPIVYYLFYRIYCRVGGTSLA